MVEVGVAAHNGKCREEYVELLRQRNGANYNKSTLAYQKARTSVVDKDTDNNDSGAHRL